MPVPISASAHLEDFWPIEGNADCLYAGEREWMPLALLTPMAVNL